MTSSRPKADLTLNARNPEDVLAMVPVTLGFTPTDSLVMLTFGATESFHARLDLPRSRGDARFAAASLLEPAARYRTREVLFVAYTDDVVRADAVTGVVREAFLLAGVEVMARLAADGRRWWHLPFEPGDPGTAYDLGTHRFAAEAVWHGLVTYGSRAELAATLGPDPGAVAETQRALARGPRPAPAADIGDEATWAAGLVRRCAGRRKPLRTGVLARLLVAMADETVRDAVLAGLTRADAPAHLELWTAVVRRCPVDHLAGPAALLGYAAWLSGNGALAWCAVDRAQEGNPGDLLAADLARRLTAALPPSAWEGAVSLPPHTSKEN